MNYFSSLMTVLLVGIEDNIWSKMKLEFETEYVSVVIYYCYRSRPSVRQSVSLIRRTPP